MTTATAQPPAVTATDDGVWRCLDIAISHLAQADVDWMTRVAGAEPTHPDYLLGARIAATQHGFVIFLAPDSPERQAVIDASGRSPLFLAVIAKARRMDAQMINIDTDGTAHADLPTREDDEDADVGSQVMQVWHAELPDVFAPARTTSVEIRLEATGLAIRVPGFGNAVMDDGAGDIAQLEIRAGRPFLTAWTDIRQEDPTHCIDFAGARETLSQAG